MEIICVLHHHLWLFLPSSILGTFNKVPAYFTFGAISEEAEAKWHLCDEERYKVSFLLEIVGLLDIVPLQIVNKLTFRQINYQS